MLLVGCQKSLRDDLSESEADDVVALLQQEGIAASKKRGESGDWSIIIDEDSEADAERLTHLYGAPRSPHATVAEIFPGTGLLPSELEEHARYAFALGHELARTIEQIDGVLAARVHVAMPAPNPRQREQPPPTASVFVRYRSDQRIDMMKNQIRTLVARALPGADAEAISVLSVPVFPPAAGVNNTRTLLGIRYGVEDAGRFAVMLVLPWLLVAAAVGYQAWRAGLHRGALARLLKARERLRDSRTNARPRRRA